MRKTFIFLFVLLFLYKGLCVAQVGFVDGVHLTTIKAPWTLSILGNDLDITKVQAKPDQQSAYFMMTSEATRLNVSVFIEPADKCKTSEECRDYILRLGNPEWGKFQDLSKGKIKEFSYFEFYRPEVRGQPVKMLDMYAEYVGQGYWVDIHISKVLFKKEEHQLFENVMSSIGFVMKSSQQSDAFDVQNTKAEESANTWLGPWDQLKCRESYHSLSSITRADNSENGWAEYCMKVNTALGEKKSRTLIAAAFTRSLPPKTDRPVAVLAYHSNFAKRESVIEIIALLLQDGGGWTVTNYLPQ